MQDTRELLERTGCVGPASNLQHLEETRKREKSLRSDTGSGWELLGIKAESGIPRPARVSQVKW